MLTVSSVYLWQVRLTVCLTVLLEKTFKQADCQYSGKKIKINSGFMSNVQIIVKSALFKMAKNVILRNINEKIQENIYTCVV